jgi:hypothetical protein
MSGHAYTEDQLVEQPAIGLFTELEWATVSALEETFGSPSPGLPRVYSPELYQQNCSAVFEHVYKSYADQGESIYAGVN